MKKILRLCVLAFLLPVAIKAQQYVTIPDTNLAQIFKFSFPGCTLGYYGNQLDTTCPDVINATSFYTVQGVSNLYGLQFLKSLTQLTMNNNTIDTLDFALLPPNLTYLDCQNSHIYKFKSLPTRLTYLNAWSNYLLELPALPDSLEYLNAGGGLFTSLPALPAKLTHLDVNTSQQLTALPALPAGLTYLDCSADYNITTLPALPAGLQYLNVSYTYITALPVSLPPALTDLLCTSARITSLPALPLPLQTLKCGQCAINTLPALPPRLRDLECSNCKLSAMPALPDTLDQLNCMENNLTSLPTLPPRLRLLYAGYNKMTSLPALPNNMAIMDCDNNLLTSLPALPLNLRELDIYNNVLTSLPPIPPNLGKLYCTNNKITSIPALPASIYFLEANNNSLINVTSLPPSINVLSVLNNPGLLCLPPLEKLTDPQPYFNISGTGITCLPNVIQHTGYIKSVDTMPICDLLNQHGCQPAWNIQGQVYDDANADCVLQNNENKVFTIKMNLYQGSTLLQSGYFPGNYSFNSGLGTYRVEADTTGTPFYPVCKQDTTVNVTNADSMQYNINFALHCKPGFDVGVREITPLGFRPGRISPVRIAAGDLTGYYGINCAGGINGRVKVTINGPAGYVSPAPGALIPDSVVGKILTWNVADFAMLNFDSAFNILIRTDTTAPIGTQVCITVVVIPTPTGDNNTANNILSECYTVRNSFDPNEKTAYPSGNTDTSAKWLTYTIRFQNTGNDVAEHIYILDTLDSHLDVSSFHFIGSSHKNITQVFEGGIVRFTFAAIDLPDSGSNEPASHGYIKYMIRLKDNLPVGTAIANTAYIYFDLNKPVITNTTVNTITASVATGIENVMQWEVNIYPNPAGGVLTISSAGFKPKRILLFDTNGKLVMELPYTRQLDISQLTNGLYFIEVKGENITSRKKLLKM